MARIRIDNDITTVHFNSRMLGHDVITKEAYKEDGNNYVDVPLCGEEMTLYFYNGAHCVGSKELEVEYKWRER